MPVNEYPIPNTVRVKAVFRDADGTLTSPGTTTAWKAAPDGTVTDITSDAVEDSEGRWHVDINIDAVGLWRATFVGDGSRKETSFKGIPSVFQNDL